MCCGSIRARCAVQAGITPFESGTSLLGLISRHWYVCVLWQLLTFSSLCGEGWVGFTPATQTRLANDQLTLSNEVFALDKDSDWYINNIYTFSKI